MKMPELASFRRGDVLWLRCEPSVGAEPRKTRACVVVSNDVANQYGAVVTVVPTQSHTAERASRAYMVDLRPPRSNLRAARVANASMVMTYDRSRVVRAAGRLSPQALRALDEALCVHLGLNLA